MSCVTRIHHLNCASFTPNLGLGLGLPRRLVSHCLVVERDDGLTLVDSGFGTADTHGRIGRRYAWALGARLDPAEPAVTQLEARGFDPRDVRDIVLTHLDLDHAGGISDFPAARIHVSASEHAAGMTPRRRRERFGYVTSQWAHGPNWTMHEPHGDRWLDFDAVQAVGDDVLLIPLEGHTRGHCGVAVRRPGGGWFLHAGDAYFAAGEKLPAGRAPIGLRAFQSAIQVDGPARRRNQERLRSLHAGLAGTSGDPAPVTIFCAHDVSEFEALADQTE